MPPFRKPELSGCSQTLTQGPSAGGVSVLYAPLSPLQGIAALKWS